IVAQLLFLEAADPEKDISIYINSPGGSITAGMAIYDTMQFIKPDVSTICTGMAASMGALLLAAGVKGKRYALPNSEVMIHQPLGGTQGDVPIMQIAAQRRSQLHEKLSEIGSNTTDQPHEVRQEERERDNIRAADAEKEYGVIDKVRWKNYKE